MKAKVCVGRQPDATYGINNTSNLVKWLIDPWKNKGCNVTMENYFTSVQLAEDLLAVKITLIGTIGKNRKEIPK